MCLKLLYALCSMLYALVWSMAHGWLYPPPGGSSLVALQYFDKEKRKMKDKAFILSPFSILNLGFGIWDLVKSNLTNLMYF